MLVAGKDMRSTLTWIPNDPTVSDNALNKLWKSKLIKYEKDKLDEIGLKIIDNRITTMDPLLDQTYDTEHFRFYYTLQDNDAVENIDYVLTMGAIF